MIGRATPARTARHMEPVDSPQLRARGSSASRARLRRCAALPRAVTRQPQAKDPADTRGRGCAGLRPGSLHHPVRFLDGVLIRIAEAEVRQGSAIFQSVTDSAAIFCGERRSVQPEVGGDGFDDVVGSAGGGVLYCGTGDIDAFRAATSAAAVAIARHRGLRPCAQCVIVSVFRNQFRERANGFPVDYKCVHDHFVSPFRRAGMAGMDVLYRHGVPMSTTIFNFRLCGAI